MDAEWGQTARWRGAAGNGIPRLAKTLFFRSGIKGLARSALRGAWPARTGRAALPRHAMPSLQRAKNGARQRLNTTAVLLTPAYSHAALG